MLERDALFKSLGDPTRRALFEALCRSGDLPVTALTKSAGVSQPAVSKHLAVLRNAGLISGRQEGRQTFYRAEPGALDAVADWTAEMKAFWEVHIDRLDDLLKRMDS